MAPDDMEFERLDETNGDWFGARYPIGGSEPQTEKPRPSDVREIVMGLYRALQEQEWPPTAKSLKDMYPNLADHMQRVMIYLKSAGEGVDPGDIALKAQPDITE